MKRIIPVQPSSLLQMDPIELNNFLNSEVALEMPDTYDVSRDASKFLSNMNAATAYICYFKEMESLAKITKRKQKRQGCTPEESDRLLGCEEVFATFKKIAEQVYEQCAKNMTLKRLVMDETKLTGTMV